MKSAIVPLLGLVLAAGCESSAHKEFREKAGQAVDSLRSLQSVVDTGIKPEDYLAKLQQTRIVIDKCLAVDYSPKESQIETDLNNSFKDYRKGYDIIIFNGVSEQQIPETTSFLEDENDIKEAVKASGHGYVIYGPGANFPNDFWKSELLKFLFQRGKKGNDEADRLLKK